MEDQRNNIDNFFREGLGSYTETPPAAVWDALEKKLDGPRKRVPYAWFLFAFLSTSVVLGFLATKKADNAIATAEKSATLPTAATQPTTVAASNEATGKTVAPATAHTTTTTAVVDGIASNTTLENNIAATEKPTNTRNYNGVKEVAGSKKTTALAINKQQISKYTGNRSAKSALSNNDSKTAPPADAGTNNVVKTSPIATPPSGTTTKTDNNTVVASVAPMTATSSIPANTTAVVNDTKPSTIAKDDVAATKTTSTSKKNKVDVITTKTAEKENTKIETVASKQNNIKVVSEVPANVLAAQAEQKANEQKLAAAVVPAKTVTTSSSIEPQKIVASNAHTQQNKAMFTETVTTIVLPATGTGNNNGAAGEAVAKDKKPSRLEFGLKAGYETGTKGVMASKYDVAPYLKYNISKKAAIIVQPGIKFAGIKNTNVDPAKYYYKLDTSFVASHTSVIGNQVTYSYNYFERGDSFKVSHSIAQHSYMEIEIPVMFSYQATKNLSILAGIAMTYSKMVSLSKDSTSYTTFNNSSSPGSVSYTLPGGSSAPTPPGINNVIPHTALPYLTLANPSYNIQTGNVFSFGYLLGFSYSLTPRWMIDGLVQQNIAGLGNVKNSDIKSLYTQPYVRLMIGFKITKPKAQ